MSVKTIAGIGGLDADLIMVASRISDPGESALANHYQEALGGKGANSAIATYRTCHKGPSARTRPSGSGPAVADASIDDIIPSEDENIEVKMIGAVGDDRYGEKFVDKLKENGVDATGIVTVPDTSTSICFVMVEDVMREDRCLFTLGATATWTMKDFLSAASLGGGIKPDLVVAQMEIHKDVVETIITIAGKAGIDFCLNAAPASPINRHLYQHLTHLLVNESEAAIMSGRDRQEVDQNTWPTIAKELLLLGATNVVIMLGAKGAF